MKTATKYCLLALFTAVLACSEKLEPTPYSYTKIFTGETSKAWSIRTISLREDGKGDQTFGLDECIKNDHYVFYAGDEKKYEVTEGNSKCSASDPDVVVSDTWSFVNATATMTIIFPLLSPYPLPYVVREATSSTMTLDIFFNDNKSSYRITFKSTGTEK